jgi:hypothetical protein
VSCEQEREFGAGADPFAVCVRCGRTTEHVAICACGCGAFLDEALRADARFINPAHKTRDWKKRSGYNAKRLAGERAR